MLQSAPDRPDSATVPSEADIHKWASPRGLHFPTVEAVQAASTAIHFPIFCLRTRLSEQCQENTIIIDYKKKNNHLLPLTILLFLSRL